MDLRCIALRSCEPGVLQSGRCGRGSLLTWYPLVDLSRQALKPICSTAIKHHVESIKHQARFMCLALKGSIIIARLEDLGWLQHTLTRVLKLPIHLREDGDQ